MLFWCIVSHLKGHNLHTVKIKRGLVNVELNQYKVYLIILSNIEQRKVQGEKID